MFYVEFLKGKEPTQKLLLKYALDSYLTYDDERDELYARTPEGKRAIETLREISPVDIISARRALETLGLDEENTLYNTAV